MRLTMQLLQHSAYSISSHMLSCQRNMQTGSCHCMRITGCCHCIAKIRLLPLRYEKVNGLLPVCCDHGLLPMRCDAAFDFRHAVCGGCWSVQAEDSTGGRQHGPVRCALDQQGLSSAAGRSLWQNWPWALLQVNQPPRHCVMLQRDLRCVCCGHVDCCAHACLSVVLNAA